MSLDKPRFRRDLEVRPVVADGQSYVEVRDNLAGTSFFLYDFEYQVALAFDGLALEKVIPWVRLATGIALEVPQLQEFARRLDELGFLERELSADPSPPAADELVAEASEHEPSGPPEPDRVVMHPTEVVDETPPSMSTVAAPKTSPSDQHARANEEPGPDGRRPQEVDTEVVGDEWQPPGDDVAAADEQAYDEGRPASDGGERLTGKESAAPRAGEAAEPAVKTVTAAEPEAASLAEPAAKTATEAEPEAASSAGLAKDTALPAPNAAGASDSTAFPVLPVTRPAPLEAPPVAAPPPWTTPRPLMTPAPSGASAPGDQPSERRRIRRSFIVFGTLGVLAAAALLAITLPFLLPTHRLPVPEARTVVASPGTVYRYFDGAGTIAAAPGVALKFPVGGKVIRVAGKGSTVAAGDVVAAVEAARFLLDQLAHQRERLAYHRQMAEAMHQVGNNKEEERQLAQIESRNARIAQTLSELGHVAVVASTAGEVEETFAREGQIVDAESPAVRVRPPGFRATFELARAQAVVARRLGLCQVEVEGYLLDCDTVEPAGDEGRGTVELASVPPALLGKPAHLARARYSGAVVLPTSALRSSRARTEVFVVSADARLEARSVVVAERDAAEAIVVQGLDLGDKVVVEPSPGLEPGMPVGTGTRR